MKNKKIHRPANIKELEAKVNELKRDGYVAVSTPEIAGARMPEGKGGGDPFCRTANYSTANAPVLLDATAGSIGGSRSRGGFGFFNAKQSTPKSTSDKVGSKGKGYIPWGPNDDVPNQIYANAGQLTYTASAVKYLVDLTVGLGPMLMYTYTTYVNGTLTTKQVPYKDACELIENRIREAEEKSAAGIDMSDQLKRLKKDLRVWTATMKEVSAFTENNNIELHYQKCMQDDVHLDIYFPTYGLSRGRKGEWKPKIVEIDHLPAICTRMEQMDDSWRINYVYFSEKWRQDAVKELEEKELVAFPSLDAAHPLRDLRAHVEKNKNKSVAERPCWVCAPNYYPSGVKPYYPQPTWWSIFPSQAYAYAFSLLSDKAAARNNSTMFGKLIFINMEYVQRLCEQAGADTEEKQSEIKDSIVNTVNEFLSKKDNNGKAAFLDSFLSDDQKQLWKAIEIVDVTTGDADKFNESDIETLANIIFLAFGVNPNLIGVSLSKASNGGTFQRELHLLKQQQVSSRQRNYLRFLQDICRFNEWDPHAEWVIRQQVLTTLDRNANGLESTTSEQ